MFPFNLNYKKTTPIIVLIICTVCAYLISEYANKIQFDIIGLIEVPSFYKVLFQVSSIFAAIIPLIIYSFLLITSETMLNYVFDESISFEKLAFVFGLAFFPMMGYYLFFLYNIVIYCENSQIHSIEDFLNIKFIFDLTLNDLKNINLYCWGCIYFISVAYLLYDKKAAIPVLFSILMPSCFMLIAYYFFFSI